MALVFWLRPKVNVVMESFAMFNVLTRLIQSQSAHLGGLPCAGLLLSLLSLGGAAQAQTTPEAVDPTALYTNAQQWVDSTLASQSASLPLRMEVVVGQLDPRLKLAACSQVQPYVPPNTRLWGKTRVGLRCVMGVSKWNVFLPITVRAFGPAWVIKGQVAQGEALSEGDAMQVEVDWAELGSPVIANASDWVGQTATRALFTGQALRQDMVKAAQVFQAGAQVRVLARGVGFEIATSGQAVSVGVMGQSAKVRMDNGRVMSGQVIDSRTIRLEL